MRKIKIWQILLLLLVSTVLVVVHLPKNNSNVLSKEKTVAFYEEIRDTFKKCDKYVSDMPLAENKRKSVIEPAKALDSYRSNLIGELMSEGKPYVNDWLYYLRVYSDQVVSYCTLIAYADHNRNMDVLVIKDSILIKQSDLNESIVKLKRTIEE